MIPNTCVPDFNSLQHRPREVQIAVIRAGGQNSPEGIRFSDFGRESFTPLETALRCWCPKLSLGRGWEQRCPAEGSALQHCSVPPQSAAWNPGTAKLSAGF